MRGIKLSVVVGVVWLMGCSDGTTEPINGVPDSGVSGGADSAVVDSGGDLADAGVDASPPSPLYALAGTNGTGAEATSLVALVDSLDADAGDSIDYAKVLEVPGTAGVIGPEKGGYFITGSEVDPKLTRYEPDGDSFKKGDEMSLEALGIPPSTISPQRAVFVSDTRMFLLSRHSPDVVEIDPSTMTITKHIPIPELAPVKIGAPANYTAVNNGMIERDGKLFVYEEAWDLTDKSPTIGFAYPVSRVAVIDVETYAVSYTTDERCGGLIWMAEGPDGALYGSTVLGAFNFIKRPATPGPCLLRIPKGSTEFDKDYYVDMDANFPGAVSATMFFDDQGSPWTWTLPKGEAPLEAIMEKGVRGFYATNAFRWTKLTSEMKPVDPQPTALQSGLVVASWPMGGERYVPTLTRLPIDEKVVNSTTLYRFVDGVPTEMITFRGHSYGAVRLR